MRAKRCVVCGAAMTKRVTAPGESVWVCREASCVRSDAHRTNHCSECGAFPIELYADKSTALSATYRCENGHVYAAELAPQAAPAAGRSARPGRPSR